MTDVIESYIYEGQSIDVIIKFGKNIGELIQQTIEFDYKNIHVNFYYVAEVIPFCCFLHICKNIDLYGKDWNRYFYYKNCNLYENEKVIYF